MNGLGYDWQVLQIGEASYSFPAVTRDTIEVTVYTIPFWPLYKGKSNAISISVDGGAEQVFENKFAEYSRSWKDQVMRNGAIGKLRFAVDPSKPSHTIRFKALDPGQMLQRVIIDWGGLKPSYVGPACQKQECSMLHNPVIFSDVPDMDIIRVNDTYYMVSTTMHFSPGCGIRKRYGSALTMISVIAPTRPISSTASMVRHGLPSVTPSRWHTTCQTSADSVICYSTLPPNRQAAL